MTATESDNDTAAITLSKTTLSVSEGGTASYKVKLATQPSADVTVTVARKSSGSQDANLSVKTGSSLTFTTSNWNTDQTVTLQAAQDNDHANGTAVFVHSAEDGGYDNVTAELTATESDDDTAAITLSKTSLSVGEGSTASYSVKLATQPSADVTVTVARKAGSDQDGNLSVKTGASLTFTSSNWNTDQSVTLQAAEDDDHANGTAVFVHSAEDGGYDDVTAELTATESDNDTAAITLSKTTLSVNEGGTASYNVKLATQPDASVTVTVARKSGAQDTDLSVKTGASLTFTTSNWNTNQSVTLQAAQDNDHANGTAVFTHSGSGGGYNNASAELTATESDDDTAAITLSKTTLSVSEGGTASYSVKLATQPSANVTVSVARKSGNDHDANLSVKTGSSLTFTTSNWNTNQTVTLQAAEDNDHANGTATFTHSASGGGYDDVTAELMATESDNDTAAITLSKSSVTVTEGGTASYKVKLATQPSDDVTVSVARKSGSGQDTNLSVKTGSSLTFTTSNWNTDQTVTLQAAEDNDAANGTAVFEHSASGGGYDDVDADITATESDNDTPGITLSVTSLSVGEGGTASYNVKLATQPSAEVTVSVARKSGNDQDANLSVKTGSSLTFTTSNWNTNQAVTLQAAEDDDHANGTAVFVHSADGGDYDDVSAELTATEGDDDTAAITLSKTTLSVDEGGTGTYKVKLATQPSGNVTVSVARKSGNDQDTNLSVKTGSSLTFTKTNWSTDQTVTLQAAEDHDHANGTATFTHSASGGGYDDVSAELTATESDNDTAAITLSKTSLSVSEGGTASYKVKLATQPSAEVTVTVARATTGSPDTNLSVKTGASLTFTTSNWNTDQTVTLQAAQDDDHANGSAKFVHTASDGGYDDVTAELTATESDDDTAAITLSKTTLSVGEGGTASYKVKLATQPSAEVTVTVARKSGSGQDTDLSVKTGASLTFTTSNWNTDQTVTLEAADDEDHANGSAVFVHTAEDGGYDDVTAEITATESDDDTAGITLSVTTLSVGENDTASYKVKLTTQPSANVTVSVARKSGNDQDANLSVKTGTSLTFTTSNWNTDQSVTLQASEDDDHADGTATFTHSASGGGYNNVTANLTATEDDNDTAAITLSKTAVTVGENSTASYRVKLATQPSANVTVSVARKSGNDQDANLSVKTGASLTFTKSNWNTNQTVTLQAADDDDHADGTATFVHSASSGGYDDITAELTATEDDDDTAAITLSTTTLTVGEGGTASYKVKLATKPSGQVTVAIARKSGGDANLSVKSGTPLTFTTSNWNTNQTVTLEATQDVDSVNGTADFTHTASGADYDDVTAELAATESDSDTPGLTLSATTLTVAENGSATYSVKLATQPGSNVTVGVARKAGSDQDADLSVKSGASLTFTTGNWNVNQTVTLQAAEDHDHADGSAAFVHTASGGGYGNVTAELTATESDNDTAAITLSKTALTVDENGTASYSVKLATQPSANATVTVARKTGNDQDPHLSVKTGASLTFTTSNWNNGQTVTIQAANDPDHVSGTATFAHTGAGGGYGNVSVDLTATEADDDSPALVLSATTLQVAEGGQRSYGVKLATLPTGEVAVAVARKAGGDAHLSVASGASLTFSTGNWNVNQTVTIQAGEDADSTDGTAVFAHAASGGGYDDVGADLTATESDNERAAVVLSTTAVQVAEGDGASYQVRLATLPTAAVTVAIASDDSDALTTSPASLQFTTSNWGTEQTVSLTAVQDADADNESVVVSHTPSGGGYGNGQLATLPVTVTDDDDGDDTGSDDSSSDQAGIVVAESETSDDDDSDGPTGPTQPTSTVVEGGSTEYAIKLDAAPSGPVTVTITSPSGRTVSIVPTTLTFDSSNWDQPQRVTVTAMDDADGRDEDITIVYAASGGGYGDVSTTWTIAVVDDDRQVALSSDDLAPDASGPAGTYAATLVEGAAPLRYTAALIAEPGGEVIVHLASSDPEAATVAPTELVFDVSNWRTGHTVTVTPVDDDDGFDESVTISHEPVGSGYGAPQAVAVVVAVADDDRQVALSSDDLAPAASGSAGAYAATLVEGAGHLQYTAALVAEPAGEVVLRLSSSDPAAATVAPAELAFDASNWRTGHTVTVTPVDDDDGFDESVTISHEPAGSGYGPAQGVAVIVAVMDDDRQVVLSSADLAPAASGPTDTYAATLVEGAGHLQYTAALVAEPAGEVVLHLASSDPAAATVVPAELVFDASNWRTGHTVTVAPVDDDDGFDESVTISHELAGSGYGARQAVAVIVAVVDDDRRVALSALSSEDLAPDASGSAGVYAATLVEGAARLRYTAALVAEPAGEVVLHLASSDPAAATVAPAELVFDASNWRTGHTVTVAPVDDDDGFDESVTISHEPVGSGYGAPQAVAVIVAVVDDDRQVVLSSEDLAPDASGSAGAYAATLVEGAAHLQYTASLIAEPGGEVVLHLASSDPAAATVAPAKLAFDASNWRTGHTVTVAPVDDDDGFDESVTISHEPAGSGYGAAQAVAVIVAVADDDRRLVQSAETIEVDEGATATYALHLATEPAGAVTVTIAASGDADLAVDRDTLAFDPGDWSVPQTVTVAAADDEDGANGEAVFVHTASGADYADLTSRLTATEIDDDPLGLAFSPAELALREGDSATYTVALATRPLDDVSVSVASGDPTVTVSPATLDFAPDAYAAPQTVTVAVLESAEPTADRFATITHAASGGDYGEVTGSVTVDVQADRHPSFGDARIADQFYTAEREIDPLVLPAASGGDGELRYTLTPAPPAGLTFNAETRTLAGTPQAAADPATYIFDATDADAADPDRASLEFRIAVAPAPRDDGLEDALAAQGRAILTSATNAIGGRFRTPATPARCVEDADRPEGDDGDGGKARNDCAGRALAYVAQALASGAGGGLAHRGPMLRNGLRGMTMGGIGETGILSAGGDPAWASGAFGTGPFGHRPADWRWDSLLWGRSFARAFGSGDDGVGRWTVWGAGDLQTFSSASGARRQTGELRSLYLGADRRLDSGWVVGAALSRNWGETDYATGDMGEGRLDTRLHALYPYARGEFASGLELWAMGGFGRGSAEVERSLGPPGDGDLTMGMGALGARQSLFSWRRLDLAALGGAGYLSLASDGIEGVDGALSVATQQARLAMELSLRTPGLAPYAELGGRYDSGDGRTGMGVEAALGVRHTGARLDFDAQGRWLNAATSGDHEELGAMARIGLKSRSDGTGWTFALSPRWGAAQNGLLGGAGAMAGGGWLAPDQHGLHAGLSDPQALSVQAELGYGLARPRLRGVLTPLLAYDRSGPTQSLTRVGFAYQSLAKRMSRDLAIEFSIGRGQRRGMGADHEVQLTFTMWPWGARPTGMALPSAPPQDAPVPAQPAQAADAPPAPPPEQAVEPPPPAAEPAPTAALLDLPPTHYAVQIAALDTEATASQFIAEHRLGALLPHGPRRHVRITHGDKTYYVVLLGTYANIEDARRAAASIQLQ